MASLARLVVLLLVVVMGFSPVCVRELWRERPSEGSEQALRPDGDSVAMNRSEKHRGLHRQRVATPGVDPVSESDGDDLAWLEPSLSHDPARHSADAIGTPQGGYQRSRVSMGAHSCRGPPAHA